MVMKMMGGRREESEEVNISPLSEKGLEQSHLALLNNAIVSK